MSEPDKRENNEIKKSKKTFFDRLKKRSHEKSHGKNFYSHSDKKLVSSLSGSEGSTIKKMKYFDKVLSKKDKTVIRYTSTILVFSIVALAVTFYFDKFEVVAVDGGEYTEGLIGPPAFINPLFAQTSDVDADLSSLIYSGLMKYDKHLNIVPDLAEHYELDEEEKVYTFFLRKDVVWHDGEKFDADDVVFTYKSIQDPAYKSPLEVSLKGIDITKIDQYTFTFTLAEPYPSFIEILTTGILPEHIWAEIPPITSNLTEYNIKPVGTGRWKRSKSITKDKLGNIKSYSLVPYEEYYGQKPFLQKLTFKFYPDFETAVAALNNRSIEGISFLPKGFETKVQNNQTNTYSFYLPQYTALFFNQKENEALKDKGVRKALARSIDKTKILTEALRLKGEIIDGPILPDFTGFDPELEKISYNPTLAREELLDAGWEKITREEYLVFIKEQEEKAKLENQENVDKEKTPEASVGENFVEKALEGSDTQPEENADFQEFYLKNDDKIFEVSITTIDLPENIKAAELIKDSWEKVGVKVDIISLPDSRIIREVIRPRKYEVLLFGVIVGADPDPYPFWHSSQIQDPGLNLSNFANRRADSLLEEARITSDSEKKSVLYKDFQEIIAEEIPAIFLYNPTYTYISHKKIIGIDIERVILPSHRFNNIEEWYVKEGRKMTK